MKISQEKIEDLLGTLYTFQTDPDEVLNFNSGPAYRSKKLRDFLNKSSFDSRCIVDTAKEGVDFLSLSHRDNPITLKSLGIGFERDVLNPTINRIHELYNLQKEDWAIFFVPGGATQMFDMVAQNFCKQGNMAYIDTGDFSQRFGNTVDDRLGTKSQIYDSIGYLNSISYDVCINSLLVTANATVEGFRVGVSELITYFDEKVILDFTSSMFTEQIDWSKIKMAFGSTTKMLGTSGATLVIVRKEALKSENLKGTTKIANLEEQFKVNGLLNTPSMYAILSAYYQTSVIQNKGGIDGVNAECINRSQVIYNVISYSNGFYKANVENDENKSIVNVVFTMETEESWKQFVEEAESMGITGLKGHKNLPLSIRASMYLDTPYDWADILAGFMIKFFQENRTP